MLDSLLDELISQMPIRVHIIEDGVAPKSSVGMFGALCTGRVSGLTPH